jgi:TonB family protein
MAAYIYDSAARRRRRLGEAAALALVLHGGALGSYVLALRAAVQPAEPAPEAIAVDALDEAASRALMDALAPLPDDETEPPRAAEREVVDQRGDGLAPTAPTRFIADDDANPAREQRRTVPSPSVEQPANPAGRVAALGSARRTPGSAAAPSPEPGTGTEARLPGEHTGEASPAPADLEGILPRGGGAALASSSAAQAPHHDPTHLVSAPQPSDPLPAAALGGEVAENIATATPAETAMVRARRSALAAFIVQVQGRVREHWSPKEVYHRVDPTLRALTAQERRTELQLRVRSDGGLESARVAASSGMPELDEEALAACQRAQPFAHPPPEVLDADGRLAFTFGFELDMAEAAYRADLSRAVREQWRPSPAYRVFSGIDRMTTVRVVLTFDGVLVHASVLSSSGMEILDRTVLAALKQGLHLPRPPAALGEEAGLVPLRLVFLHSVRGANDVRVIRETREQ